MIDPAREDLIRASEEEVERSVWIALALTRDMYLRFAAQPRGKLDRQAAQKVIAQAVLNQLRRFEFYREKTEFDRAPQMLPLFDEKAAF